MPYLGNQAWAYLRKFLLAAFVCLLRWFLWLFSIQNANLLKSLVNCCFRVRGSRRNPPGRRRRSPCPHLARVHWGYFVPPVHLGTGLCLIYHLPSGPFATVDLPFSLGHAAAGRALRLTDGEVFKF